MSNNNNHVINSEDKKYLQTIGYFNRDEQLEEESFAAFQSRMGVETRDYDIFEDEDELSEEEIAMNEVEREAHMLLGFDSEFESHTPSDEIAD